MNVPQIDVRPGSNGYPQWPEKIEQGLINVRIATFVSLLIPNRIISDVGLPLKEMFIWGDDSEYTQRISRKSTSYFVAKSIVVHKRQSNGGLSILSEQSMNRVRLYYFMYRNGFYNVKKYGNWRKVLGFTLSSIVVLLRVLFVADYHKYAKSVAICKGFVNGLFFAPQVEYPTDSVS